MHLVLILPIMYWLFKTRETKNPFIYVGIIVISLLGVIITLNSTTYITTGYYTTFNETGSLYPDVYSYPITEDLSGWNYILMLFYIFSFIGGVLYWAFNNENKAKDDL